MTQETETFDFVIVGSGGGSMCAALVAKMHGLTPLILEKTDLFGGTTAKSGGIMWIPNNRFLREAGIGDSTENAMLYLDALADNQTDAPGASRDRRLAYVNEAPKLVDFLVQQGIKLQRHPYWPDYYTNLPGAIEQGRAVYAELFDGGQLGAMLDKLRPNFMPVPVKSSEMWDLPLFRTTWRGKRTMARVALRAVVAKILRRRWLGGGSALQGGMLLRSMQMGIDMRTNAAVDRLITDEGGAVRGVVARIDGRERTIFARHGVLVNAGGFAQNQEMRDTYLPGTSTAWTGAIASDTGEMIVEMTKVGASLAQMDEMDGNQVALPPGNPDGIAAVVSELAKPHSMVVDQSGERYLNETQSHMAFCQAMRARHAIAPAVPSWIIFDSQYVAKYMVAGTMPGTAKPQVWYDQGWLKRANSIRELASACNIAPATLDAQVERFNRFARSGVDDDFGRGGRAYDRFLGDSAHRPSPTMGAIEKGPFFAYQFYPGDVGTFGGVVTDTNARVLRDDGSVIEGLYATGVSTASVMGRVYPGAGSSVGPSFVWGYIAANHAAESALASKDGFEGGAASQNRMKAAPMPLRPS